MQRIILIISNLPNTSAGKYEIMYLCVMRCMCTALSLTLVKWWTLSYGAQFTIGMKLLFLISQYSLEGYLLKVV